MRKGRKDRTTRPEFMRFNLMCIRAADAILKERHAQMDVFVGQIELDYANVKISEQDGSTVVDIWGPTKGGWICHIVLYVDDAGFEEIFRFEVTFPEHSIDQTLTGRVWRDAATGERPVTFDNLSPSDR